ncbi:MAG: site-2 protease family protein, partial [Actinobacteria bacterium]|nr:site-2 protease family protein [Actinomycetota bacterium]
MTAAVMLIGIVLMIVIHEGGHFVAAKAFNMKATEAFFGFGPKLWSITRGETEYGIKAIPLGGYVRIIGMSPGDPVAAEDADRTYRAAPFWQKTIVVLAGIASHFVVAFLLFFLVFSVWGQIARDEEGDRVPTLTLALVARTTPDGAPAPARIAGFEEGDVLTSLDGAVVTSWTGFVDLVQVKGGDSVVIGYDRGGEPAQVPVTLALVERPLFVDGEAVTDDNGNVITEEIGYFGAAPEIERFNDGFISNIGAAGSALVTSMWEGAKGLWALIVGFPDLLRGVFTGDDEILNEVRPITPIGLVRIAGPLESTLGILALVNVFVGIVNVIPLYPLDGGHFAVALYEKLTGRV